ncbi:25952_t:CDS:2, partial [Gigaspora margarita]
SNNRKWAFAETQKISANPPAKQENTEKKSTADHYAENILPYNQKLDYLTTKYSPKKEANTSIAVMLGSSSHINILNKDCFIEIDNALYLNSSSTHCDIQKQDIDVQLETLSNMTIDEDPLDPNVFIVKQYIIIIVVQEAKLEDTKSNATILAPNARSDQSHIKI